MSGYIPFSAIRQVVSGSYENTIQEITNAICDSYQSFGVSSPEDISVIATFPRNAIVLSEDGKFFRTWYKREKEGICVSTVESVDVPVLKTRADQKKFLSESAMDAVESILSGDMDSARKMARELVQSGNLLKDQDPLQEAMEGLTELFNPDRPWRKTYAESSTTIHRVLWGASGATFRYSPKPKYNELYAESDGADVSSYHSEVLADMQSLNDKLKTIWGWVEESWGKYDTKHGMFKGLEISSIAEDFERFAADYLDELRTVCKMTEQASNDLDDTHTPAMAMVYDSIAKNYAALEVGARLIQRVASELSNVV